MPVGSIPKFFTSMFDKLTDKNTQKFSKQTVVNQSGPAIDQDAVNAVSLAMNNVRSNGSDNLYPELNLTNLVPLSRPQVEGVIKTLEEPNIPEQFLPLRNIFIYLESAYGYSQAREIFYQALEQLSRNEPNLEKTQIDFEKKPFKNNLNLDTEEKQKYLKEFLDELSVISKAYSSAENQAISSEIDEGTKKEMEEALQERKEDAQQTSASEIFAEFDKSKGGKKDIELQEMNKILGYIDLFPFSQRMQAIEQVEKALGMEGPKKKAGPGGL